MIKLSLFFDIIIESKSVLNKYFFTALILAVLFPGVLQAAELSIDPNTGERKPGDIFPVSLMIESSDEFVNSISATFDFPADLLEVVSVSKRDSIIDLWTTGPSYSNRQGTIDFEGVILDAGFKGLAGEILTVNFKALAEGEAVLEYLYSKASANDGQGLDLISSAQGADFSIKTEEQKEPEPEAQEEEADQGQGEGSNIIKIRSYTHPESDKWYSDTVAEFYWELPEEVREIKLLVNRTASSAPVVHYDYRLASKKIEDFDDGQWYLHAQAKNAESWGPIDHFSFQIDTAIPYGLSIDEASSSGSFSVSAQDDLSGIDHYVIKTDGATSTVIWQEGEDIFQLYGVSAGDHVLSVSAFDRAGNQAILEQDIHLEEDLPSLVAEEDKGQVKAEQEEVSQNRISTVNRFEFLDFKFSRFDLSFWQIVSISLAALSLLLFIYVVILKNKLKHCRNAAFKKMKKAERVLNSVYAIIYNSISYLDRAKSKKKRFTVQEAKVYREMKKAKEEIESEYK
ncbi:hypothetical protein GF382_01150 [Candidatus Falkowbacteria bacterium]|nr:hypothetical protein [Candidatus Falkowbacteria bacterium]